MWIPPINTIVHIAVMIPTTLGHAGSILTYLCIDQSEGVAVVGLTVLPCKEPILGRMNVDQILIHFLKLSPLMLGAIALSPGPCTHFTLLLWDHVCDTRNLYVRGQLQFPGNKRR